MPATDSVNVHFGVYLPGITDPLRVRVLVISEEDRFTAGVTPQAFDLQPLGGPNGLWAADATVPAPRSASGRYLYRYQLLRGGGASDTVVTSWFTDPFARETDDVGQLSAFTTPGAVPDFVWTDDGWKVPEQPDLVVYELHVEEFNRTFAGVLERLPYLKSLGVNCLELMPVTSMKVDFDWGYGPLHYFAPSQRWGGVSGLKALVDGCHAAGVAVILDVVYQHVDPSFPYAQVYADAGVASPMIEGSGPFGPVIDYAQPFARDYVRAVGEHWLDEYHVDGFRYDEVTDLYDGPIGQKYAAMAYDAYETSLGLPRFTPSGGAAAGEYSRIIQVPEALNRPQQILTETYSTATWQDNLLGKAQDMLGAGYVDEAFAHLLDADFSGYPRTKSVHDIEGAAVEMPVGPFQYVASHDHSHPIASLPENRQSPTYAPLAKRDRWYKIQPFVIALYTASGVPMLWQGQEFTENYVLAGDGDLRVHFRRDMHWEYFYDDLGAPLVRLHRTLGTLRADHPCLRGRDSWYDNQNSRPSDGVIAYRRSAASELAIVYLNFSELAQTISVPMPVPGTYRELVDDAYRSAHLDVAGGAGDPLQATVPSNYGYVFVVSTAA